MKSIQRNIDLTQEKRQRIKQGGLFIPWVFSFGAELEGLPVSEFLEDATKLSNSLRTIHNFFQCDGVVSQGDPLLLAEVFGCSVSRDRSPPSLTQNGGFPDEMEILTERLSQTGRVATALDVTRRLSILLPNTLLLNIIPGPVTLTAQLAGMTAEEACQDPELLGKSTRAVVTFTKTLGDAGADMLVVHENVLPQLDHEVLKRLRRCYAPLWNTAKFYDLSPLLMLGQWDPENADQLGKIVDEIIFPAGSLPDNKRNSKRLSLSLPASLLTKGPQEIQNFLEQQEILNIARESRLFFLSTDVEIPSDIHKESLIRGIQTIKDTINEV